MHARRKSAIVFAASLLLAAAPSSPAPLPDSQAADPWAGMRFLLGEWTSDGAPGAGSGSSTFALDLDGKILVRKNRAVYAPKPGEKAGSTHDDLMIVYPAPGALAAIYFDNEGHVIEYRVTAADSGVTFESPETTPGPRYRLVYASKDPGSVAGTFSIAAPGKPYQTYLSWTAHRR